MSPEKPPEKPPNELTDEQEVEPTSQTTSQTTSQPTSQTTSQTTGKPAPGHRDKELRAAIEALFFAYRAFTEEPDEILARRGLGRVHHRILYFVGREPCLSVSRLLEVLGVSKQALHTPLRQLSDAGLIDSQSDESDKRIRQLSLTTAGKRLEAQLTRTQTASLARAFESSGAQAEAGWRKVMKLLGQPE